MSILRKTQLSFSHTRVRKLTLAPGDINAKFKVSTVASEASWYLVLFYLSHLITTSFQHAYCSIRSVSLQICSNIYSRIDASAPHRSVKVQLRPRLSYERFPITLILARIV